MYAIKVYLTAKDFDEFIKNHLSKDDSARFADCEWVPVKINVTDLLEIEVTAVPTKIPAEVNSL